MGSGDLSDADAMAADIAATYDRRSAAEARHLTGPEVDLLRAAIADAADVLAGLNTKALPMARRRQVEQARHRLELARPLVAARSGAADTIRPPTGGRPR